MKRNNSHYVNSGRTERKGTEGTFKAIIPENFPNLGRKMNSQIYEAERIPIG